MQLGSGIAVVWYRPAAAALIQPLALELLYAAFAATWLDLEVITLSEVGQTKTMLNLLKFPSGSEG